MVVFDLLEYYDNRRLHHHLYLQTLSSVASTGPSTSPSPADPIATADESQSLSVIVKHLKGSYFMSVKQSVLNALLKRDEEPSNSGGGGGFSFSSGLGNRGQNVSINRYVVRSWECVHCPCVVLMSRKSEVCVIQRAKQWSSYSICVGSERWQLERLRLRLAPAHHPLRAARGPLTLATSLSP